MVSRVIAATLAGTTAAFSLTACLGDKKDESAPPSSSAPAASDAPSSQPPASSSPAADAPPGWRTIGGPENGVRISIPKGWEDIQLTSGEAEEGLAKLGLKGANQELLRQSMEQLKQRKAVYAIEAESAVRGYATNVNALCVPSPATSIEQLKTGTRAGMSQLGASDVQVADATVAGRPGIRTTYVLKSAAGALTGYQVQVAQDGRACSLTITSKQGEMPGNAEDIANTMELV